MVCKNESGFSIYSIEQRKCSNASKYNAKLRLFWNTSKFDLKASPEHFISIEQKWGGGGGGAN